KRIHYARFIIKGFLIKKRGIIMKQKLLWPVLCIGLLFVLAACGFDDYADSNNNGASNEGNNNGNKDAEGDVEGAEDGVIQIFEDSENTTIDSYHAHDYIGINTLNNTNEGLYRGDDNYEPQPALAEDVDVSDDETVHTFTLREDAVWSNGDHVSAHVFEYAWSRTFDTVGNYAIMFVYDIM